MTALDHGSSTRPQQGQRLTVLLDFDHTLVDTEAYRTDRSRLDAFPDTQPFLDRLRRELDARLVLLSYVQRIDIQAQKIVLSGLGREFDEIILTDDPTKSRYITMFAGSGERVVLVDDSGPVLDAAVRAGIGAIWIRRDPDRLPPTESVPVVSSLLEVLDLLPEVGSPGFD